MGLKAQAPELRAVVEPRALLSSLEPVVQQPRVEAVVLPTAEAAVLLAAVVAVLPAAGRYPRCLELFPLVR